MKIIKYGLLIFLLVIITQVAHAQSLKSSSPNEVTVIIGDTFETFVKAENVTNFFGVSFNYDYDENYLKLVSVTSEDFLGSDVVFFPNDDVANGVLSVGISRKAGQENASGTGNIIKATFEIINLPQQDKTIDFIISDVAANNSNGETLSMSSENSTTLLKISPQSNGKLISESPTELSAKVGDTFETFVKAENVSNFFGVSFNYDYDENYLKLVSATNEDFLGSDVVFFPNDNASSGILSVGISRKAGQENASGTGDIIKVTFEIINLPQQNSTIDFIISEITANNNSGSSIILDGASSETLLNLSSSLGSNKLFPISPAVINGNVGTEFNTQIYIENASNLFGVSFNFNYSHKILEVLSVEEDNFFGNDIVFFPNIDNLNGKVSVGISKKAGQDNVTGSGVLLNIKSKLISLPEQDSSITFLITDLVGNDKDGNTITLFDSTSVSLIDITTDINDTFDILLDKYSLNQNYPNPFNPTTSITFSIPEAGFYALSIYNLLGQKVSVLGKDNYMAGSYNIQFNAENLPSGTYIYQLLGNNINLTKKMILLK